MQQAWLRSFFLAVASLAVAFISGCGMNREHPAPRTVVVQQKDEFAEALRSSPASGALTMPSPALGPADAESAVCAFQSGGPWVLDEAVSMRDASVDGTPFFDRCLAYFACSAHGAQQQAWMAAQGRPFRISFVDFPSLPGATQVNGRWPLGLYLVGEDRVYIQQRVASGWSTLEACGALIHELYHFNDRGVDHEGESLEVEFPAHHLQQWFLIEARQAWMDAASVPENRRNGVPGVESTRWTRGALAQGILSYYGLASWSESRLSSFLSQFDPFPGESSEILLSGNP